MKTVDILDKVSASYDITEHHKGFTSQQEAADQDVPGVEVAKAQVVRIDDEFYLFVLAEHCDIDYDILRKQFGAEEVRVADTEEVKQLLPDCEPGEELPIGAMYNLMTFLDREIGLNDYIVFRCEERDKTVRMEMCEYKRLTSPRILTFSYPNR